MAATQASKSVIPASIHCCGNSGAGVPCAKTGMGAKIIIPRLVLARSQFRMRIVIPLWSTDTW
jgi:hypothetical protein